MYEYRCDACGHRFERIQKFSDSPIEVCPSCGAHSVQKLLSSPAIQFKGSGFYITDYARKGEKQTDSADKPAATDSKDTKDSKGASSDSKSSSDAKSATDSKSSTDAKSSTTSSSSTDKAPAKK